MFCCIGQLEQGWLLHSYVMTVWVSCQHGLTFCPCGNWPRNQQMHTLRPTNTHKMNFNKISINLMCWKCIDMSWLLFFIVAKIGWWQEKYKFLCPEDAAWAKNDTRIMNCFCYIFNGVTCMGNWRGGSDGGSW